MQSGGSCEGPLLLYRRNGLQLVDPNLIVDAAVAQREVDSVADAQARTVANSAIGQHQISPKKAKRVNNTIYFSVRVDIF